MTLQTGETGHHDSLLQALIAIQDSKGFIDEEDACRLSHRFGVSVAKVMSLISFYHFLLDRDHGPYRFLFSDNITDKMAGSEQLMAQLCTHLCVKPNQINPAARVYVSTTSCIGLSDQGPSALVNGRPLSQLNPQRINQIAALVDAGVPVALWPARFFNIESRIQHRGRLLQTDLDLMAAVTRVWENGADWFLGELEKSGLRGLGGAGFPTARKWRTCRETDASMRVVVCNADEGEPGTFKDRVLLTDFIDDVLAGMAIAAETLNAGLGFIYLRGEYAYLRPSIDAAIARAFAKGILPSEFELSVHLGAGAYICGEESALIESLEGNRGIPRQRPPYQAEYGYRGLPTLVNNVETFVTVSRIALYGGDWLRECGTEQSPGTRLLSISGDCARPGIYEVAHGTRVDHVLAMCGASQPLAVQIAGAAGQTLPASRFHHTIANEDIPTGGSFMVLGQGRDLLDLVENVAGFFERESCGFCTPCRTGCPQLSMLARKLRSGSARQADVDRVHEIAAMLKNVAFCGFGTTASNTFEDVIHYFPEVVKDKIVDAPVLASFDVQQSLQEARRSSGASRRESPKLGRVS